jgi:hypothetical protein
MATFRREPIFAKNIGKRRQIRDALRTLKAEKFRKLGDPSRFAVHPAPMIDAEFNVGKIAGVHGVLSTGPICGFVSIHSGVQDAGSIPNIDLCS